jgi:release factor H-coupled RctB family protein
LLFWRHPTARFAAAGLDIDAPEADAYREAHDAAVRWAAANRAAIAERFLSRLSGAAPRCVLDLCHNSVTPCRLGGSPCWLHRKGAAPADQGPLVIPGSRGAYSYLVVPTGPQDDNAWSLAHGAGRKWNRSAIKSRLLGEVALDSLRRTKLGSVVLCDDKELLLEEAPEAYKRIETVIDDLTGPGLVRVVARLRPLLTFKRG